MTLLVVWRNEDGRVIRVLPDHKEIQFNGFPNDSFQGRSTLLRSTVPNLTDEEWEAQPIGPGWTWSYTEEETS